MPLFEKTYEKHLLQELPPHARDIADFLFNGKPLVFFIQQQQSPKPDIELLNNKKVPHKFWNEIIEAALLAKLTNMDPSPLLRSDQILFLIHSSCVLIKMPLSQYSLEEVVSENEFKMPKFSHWIKSMAAALRNAN